MKKKKQLARRMTWVKGDFRLQGKRSDPLPQVKVEPASTKRKARSR